ncbi:hypothetical protein NQ318_002384 [Aromia moschata]|uniref:EH domain-containing protein n=1 Tax=Aromia moschata TaxID=1265417 RepID=A0AAV8YF84_9CUCU|nr:hypothetical protein NQ318_002384 [Aromia moschata]
MSAAGTPSTDPWVIVARERARYEEQFKSLKPNNGIITGEQAKGFFLQSQLPPLILGQIWYLGVMPTKVIKPLTECGILPCTYPIEGIPPIPLERALADTDSDVNTPPAIPPLPNTSAISAPPRPEPPKVAPMISQPLVQNPTLVSNQSLLWQVPASQPLVPGLSSGLISQPPISHISSGIGGIPSIGGVQGNIPPVSGLITSVGIAPPTNTTIPTDRG